MSKMMDLLSSIIGEVKHLARTETIVGEPVTFDNRKLVPVSRICVGFGVGGGEGSSPKQGEGFGGGGGGGVRVEPVGFIVIAEDGISFLPTKQGKFEGLIEAIPAMLNKLKEMKKEKEAKGETQSGHKE